MRGTGFLMVRFDAETGHGGEFLVASCCDHWYSKDPCACRQFLIESGKRCPNPLRDRNIERVVSWETKVEPTQKRLRRSDIGRDRLLAQRSP